jgi:hypothetical protein
MILGNFLASLVSLASSARSRVRFPPGANFRQGQGTDKVRGELHPKQIRFVLGTTLAFSYPVFLKMETIVLLVTYNTNNKKY